MKITEEQIHDLKNYACAALMGLDNEASDEDRAIARKSTRQLHDMLKAIEGQEETEKELLRYFPSFADVNPNTLCLDPASIEAKITPRTRAA